MKKKISILGSTGSIGKTLFKILKKDKINFEIILLTTNKNINEFLDIGTCIKNQIQDNKLIIRGFDNDFNIKCEVI